MLATSLGQLRISAERVRCEGEGCPIIATVAADILIAGSDAVGLGLMPLMMQGYAAHIDAIAASTAIATDNNEMATLVNADPAAVGYVGFAIQRGAKPLPIVNECGITTTPDSFSAKTEEYALQRRLYLYKRADVTVSKVAELMAFATSPNADNMVRKAGFIDLGVEVRGQGLDTDRAASLQSQSADSFEGQFAEQMLAEMVDYDRLSTTFRFRVGSSKLDERGRLDMKRLVDFLQTQPDTAELVMVGFTDNVGAFESNMRLSVERASSVISQMASEYPEVAQRVSLKASGFGEVAPVACNASDTGRAINRRVGIWLKTKVDLASNSNFVGETSLN